jgi:mono/diheme cytochrome c family protein
MMSVLVNVVFGVAIVAAALTRVASRDTGARSLDAPAAGSVVRRPARLSQPPDGRQLYATTCSACHQLTGLGLPDVYPPLAGSEWVTGDEERLIRVVLHGLTGEIEVAGEMVSGAMPAWGESLDDAAMAAVLTYIRRTWNNAAPAVVPATVARVRRATVGRTSPWTAKELAVRTPPPG